MDQYHPRAHVGKARRGASVKVVDAGSVETSTAVKKEVRYADINRPVNQEEVSSVKRAAEEAGLWRFVEPARHGGFNI
jgi:putative pyruvate formate lyase activating enzyme